MNLLGLGLIVLASVLLALLTMRQRRSLPTLRPIAAMTRLYRAIGLSVEDGTRLLVLLGGDSLLTRNGAAPLAGLNLLRNLSERTSLSDRPPVAAAGEAPLALLAQDTMEAGYEAAGAGEYFQPVNGRVAGLTPFSAAAAAMLTFGDEGVSTGMLLGHFGSEAALLAEASDRENALLVGSSDEPSALAALFAAAPETLIGEELFAASAYLGSGPTHTASLTVQDILRWIVVAALLAGAGLKLFGII